MYPPWTSRVSLSHVSQKLQGAFDEHQLGRLTLYLPILDLLRKTIFSHHSWKMRMTRKQAQTLINVGWIISLIGLVLIIWTSPTLLPLRAFLLFRYILLQDQQQVVSCPTSLTGMLPSVQEAQILPTSHCSWTSSHQVLRICTLTLSFKKHNNLENTCLRF